MLFHTEVNTGSLARYPTVEILLIHNPPYISPAPRELVSKNYSVRSLMALWMTKRPLRLFARLDPADLRQ